VFIIWQSTVKPDADLTPFTIGVTVSGRNAGEIGQLAACRNVTGRPSAPGHGLSPAAKALLRPARIWIP
jgi:hypothetical protein